MRSLAIHAALSRVIQANGCCTAAVQSSHTGTQSTQGGLRVQAALSRTICLQCTVQLMCGGGLHLQSCIGRPAWQGQTSAVELPGSCLLLWVWQPHVQCSSCMARVEKGMLDHLRGPLVCSCLWAQVLWVRQACHVCERRQIAGPPWPLQHLGRRRVSAIKGGCHKPGHGPMPEPAAAPAADAVLPVLPADDARSRQAWAAAAALTQCRVQECGNSWPLTPC